MTNYLNVTKQRVIYFDVLTILSAIGVVSLHSVETFYSFRLDTSWYIVAFIQCLFSFCVPIFFMISGANLIGYQTRYSTKRFVEKRLINVFLPFIVWGILWYLFNGLFLRYYDIGIIDFLSRLTYGQIEPILWFLYAIISLYVLTPFLSLLATQKKGSLYLLGIFFLFFFSKSIIWLPYDLLHRPIPLLLNLVEGNQYLAYYVLGFLLTKKEYLKNIKSRYLIFMFLCVTTFTFLSTVYLSSQRGEIVQSFYIFSSPFCYLASVLLWTVVSRIKFTSWSSVWIKGILSVSGCCFGIYIIHLIIQRIIQQLDIFNLSNAFWFLCLIPINFIVSFLLIFILKKIPVIKKLIP